MADHKPPVVDLTRQFCPSGTDDEVRLRGCEDLAQAFTDLYSNTQSDDELLLLFQTADEALSTLISEIYKRAEPDGLTAVLQAARTAVREPTVEHLDVLRTALEDY